MGALSNGVCYASQAEAADAYFSASPPFGFGPSYHIAFPEKIGGTWRYSVRSYADNGSSVGTMVVTVPTFPTCTVVNTPEQNFADGVILGWGIVAAMAIAWGAKLMIGELRVR